MNKAVQTITLIVFLAGTLSCEKYEPKTYQELRDRMHTTYVGKQTGDGTQSFFDEEVQFLPMDDSSSMVIGRFYDSLIVNVTDVDYSNGHVFFSGDSISYLSYLDEDESLLVIKELSIFYMYTGKRKK